MVAVVATVAGIAALFGGVGAVLNDDGELYPVLAVALVLAYAVTAFVTTIRRHQ